MIWIGVYETGTVNNYVTDNIQQAELQLETLAGQNFSGIPKCYRRKYQMF